MTFNNIIQTLPENIFNKLLSLKNLTERKDFHPEENCFLHVQIVTNRCIAFGDNDLICAGIFHDLHKLDTMKINPKTGNPTSPGHDSWARKTVQTDNVVRQWITDFGADPDTVACLCGEHMRIHQMSQMRPVKQKMLMELPFFDKLAVFACFDDMTVCDTKAQLNAQDILTKTACTVTMSQFGKMGSKNR